MMMKRLLLTATLLTGLVYGASAQTDYCADIVKASTKSTVFYESPTPGDKKEEVGKLGFVKTVDEEGTKIYFKLGMGLSDYGSSKTDVSITFEDDDVLTFTDVPVTKGVEIKLLTETETLYSTLFTLTPDQFAKFKTKKLKFYNIFGKKRYPGLGNPKVKLMAYANCLDNLNDKPIAVNNPNEKKSIDGFWGIKFGASIDEAKAAVTTKGGKLNAELTNADRLVYDDVTFTGRTTELMSLNFISGKFYEALVVYPEPDESQLISQFQKITSELAGVYGDAEIVKDFQPPYKDGDGYEVSAIKQGKANYFAKWKTNNGNTIQLQINKKGNLSIYYTDRTLEKQKDAKKSSDY